MSSDMRTFRQIIEDVEHSVSQLIQLAKIHDSDKLCDILTFTSNKIASEVAIMNRVRDTKEN